jgi:glycosyltransferase involved in cell wall biosynthesis
MACGLPCVATTVGDIRTAVAGDAVLVAPGDAGALADALDGLLSDPQGRHRLGCRARERALRAFTVERMVAQTEAVMLRALTATR